MPNPQHKRAQLVTFTVRERELFEKVLVLQQPWAAGLAEGMTELQVAAACDVLDLILGSLDAQRNWIADAVTTSPVTEVFPDLAENPAKPLL